MSVVSEGWEDETVAKAPSKVLAGEVARLRRARGWSTEQLSDRLRELGVLLHPTAITKLEKGDRGVSLDEAFALAVAFKVPLSLMALPLREGADVALTPTTRVHAWRVWEWLHGLEPLVEDNDIPQWRGDVQPAWLYDGVREAQKAAQRASAAVPAAEYFGDPDGVKSAREGYVTALWRLHQALEAVKGAGFESEGLLADEFRADMVRFGIRKEE
jgi:transcriptional regulator with XRE-family HTH domain